jgi:carbamoyl-phosphate synthase large subunit
MNIQFAVKDGEIFVLEVNPRASRTVPFVSKATGLNLAQAAARVMVGRSLDEQGITVEPVPRYISVKEAVFPFNKFREFDPILGPEMRSTGEVMGVADNFGEAFAKAQIAAGQKLPTQGSVFISVTDHDKAGVAEVARRFADMGFKLVATAGTADIIESAGLSVERVYKVKEGRPNVVDLIKGDRIQLIINTPHGADPWFDEKAIRRAAVTARITTITTLSAARAAAPPVLLRPRLVDGERPVVYCWPLRAATAACASWSLDISTDPNPLDRPVTVRPPQGRGAGRPFVNSHGSIAPAPQNGCSRQ